MGLRGRVGRTVDGTGECSTLRAVRVCVCAWECAMAIISAISTRCSLPRLATALVGLFAVALIAVVATEPRTASAQPPATIEETELILTGSGNVGVGSWNSFHWGGGTVRQLLDRLIQSGCAVDADASDGLLWEWTGSGWGKRYALLNDRASARGVSSRDINMPPGTLISGMLDTVPRGTYFVRCVAGCGILRSGEDDVSLLENCPSQFDRAGLTQAGQVRRDWGEEVDKKLVPRDFVAPPGADSRSANGLCWPLDHQRLAEWRLHLVLPYFAIHPGTCLLRESDTASESGTAGGRARPPYQAPPVLALFEQSPLPTESEQDDSPLGVTVHEYCHANQYWHMQRSSRYETHDDVLRRFPGIPAKAWRDPTSAAWWAYATPAGQAFVRAVSMSWSDSAGWTVPSAPFNEMYRLNPLELAAEVCEEYLGKILEIDSQYAWETWSADAGGPSGAFARRAERKDWDPGAVLTPRVVQWLNDWVLLPHVDTGLGQRPTDLKQCKEDMRVGLGQSCWVPNAPARFVVPDDANGYAWSPCDQHDVPGDLNEARIKVDVEQPGTCGSLPKGWTFQAERVGDAWYVRVVGQWRNVGECASDQVDEVGPGEYCTVSLWQTGPGDPTAVQFRVYAVDELVPSDIDNRLLYSRGGYAVLYYWPDDQQPHADNGRLHHSKVRHPANGVALFGATKMRHRGEWRIDFAPS